MRDSHPFPHGSTVAGYFRDSGGTEQDLSVTQQQAYFRLWCSENNYIAGRIFADLARSGGTTAGRDQLDALLTYLTHKPAISGVAFWDYSRIARNFDDGQYVLATIRRAGYGIYSLNEAVPAGSVGRIVEALHLWRAEEYRVELGRNVKRGLHHLVSEYKCWPGGKTPTGFTTYEVEIGKRRDGSPHIGHRLMRDGEAPHVRHVFELRASGATLPEILAEIPLVGSTASLGRLLRNKLYIGVFVYGEFEIQNFAPAVVDLETWDAAQRVNDQRRDRHGYNHPRQVRSRFYLTGIARCGRCGMPLHGRVIQRKHYRQYDYYRCQSINVAGQCGAQLIPKDELETRVLDCVRDVLAKPTYFEELYKSVLDVRSNLTNSTQTQLDQQRAELKETDAALGRVTAAIEAAGHSPALIARLHDLEAKRLQIVSNIDNLRKQIDTARPEVTRRQLADRLRRLREFVERADPRWRSQALRGLIADVRAEKSAGVLTGAVVFYNFDESTFVVPL